MKNILNTKIRISGKITQDQRNMNGFDILFKQLFSKRYEEVKNSYLIS
jgi:hypothetical protein